MAGGSWQLLELRPRKLQGCQYKCKIEPRGGDTKRGSTIHPSNTVPACNIAVSLKKLERTKDNLTGLRLKLGSAVRLEADEELGRDIGRIEGGLVDCTVGRR